MKQISCAIMALLAASAFAQPTPSTIVKKHGGDLVQLVNVNQMPVPVPKSELEKVQMAKANAVIANDGFSTVTRSPEDVRRFYTALDIAKTSVANPSSGAANLSSITENQDIRGQRAPVVFKDLSHLKLGFAAVSVSHGELIGVAPHGTMIGDAWTGVERFYRIEGAGHMRLTESDMGLTDGMFFMIKDAVNTSVAGKPAISVVFTDDDGQQVEEILWVNGTKLYTLTFAPEMSQGRFGKTKSNVRISAPSLAQELR